MPSYGSVSVRSCLANMIRSRGGDLENLPTTMVARVRCSLRLDRDKYEISQVVDS